LQTVNSSPIATANPLQLKDIHIPEQVSNYPIAYGWWLLAIIMLLTMTFIAVKLYKKSKIKRAQQQALKQLQNSPTMSNTEIITLLKWASMQYFSRTELASLYSNQFKQFLLQQLDKKYQQQFDKLSTKGFENQYQKFDQKSDADFLQGAILWLNHALPPKAKQQKNTTYGETAGAIK